MADECGYQIMLHPPTNSSERAWREVPKHMRCEKKPFLERNKDIVLETASLIAAPDATEEQMRSGTWSTVRFPRKLGKPVFLILPDGTVQR
jgi:predicted Rossmann fold nucleotide-binding protein DprA/Smf involved in DNA uptake